MQIDCPTCDYPMRFSRTIFQDQTEIWRCDYCGREITIAAADDDATLVVDPPFRDEFNRRMGITQKMIDDLGQTDEL